MFFWGGVGSRIKGDPLSGPIETMVLPFCKMDMLNMFQLLLQAGTNATWHFTYREEVVYNLSGAKCVFCICLCILTYFICIWYVLSRVFSYLSCVFYILLCIGTAKYTAGLWNNTFKPFLPILSIRNGFGEWSSSSLNPIFHNPSLHVAVWHMFERPGSKWDANAFPAMMNKFKVTWTIQVEG